MYQDLSTFVHAITNPLDAARESFFDICLGLVQQRDHLIREVRGILRRMPLCHRQYVGDTNFQEDIFA